MKTDLFTHQRNRLIRLKVKLTREYFDIKTMKEKNIEKIERCDNLIKNLYKTNR